MNIDDNESNEICLILRNIFEEIGKSLNIKSLKGISIALVDEGYRKG